MINKQLREILNLTTNQERQEVIDFVKELMTKSENRVWVYDVIEYELGWGSKHDGYLCFSTDKDALQFIFNENVSRKNKPTPDFYYNYTNGRFENVSEELVLMCQQDAPNGVYTDEL